MSDYGMFSKEDLYGLNGKMKTQSLFREFFPETGQLTLSKHDTDGCINLRQIYISFCIDDPTEVTFAESVFGDYAFWENLRSLVWMKPNVEEWERIADVKRKQKAFATLIQDATDKDSRTSVTSAKYLIDEPWKGRKKETKEKVKESTSEAFSQVRHDLERMKEHMN